MNQVPQRFQLGDQVDMATPDGFYIGMTQIQGACLDAQKGWVYRTTLFGGIWLQEHEFHRRVAIMHGRYSALRQCGRWRFYQKMPSGQLVEIVHGFNPAWRRNVIRLFWEDMKMVSA